MKINEHGICLHKTELKALLRFAAKDKESNLFVIHFTADDTWIYAYATDGHRALQAKGLVEHEDAVKGEWTVNKAYLADCYKLLTANDHLILRVSGASLHSAGIVDIDSQQERSTMESPSDAASTQMTFPVKFLVEKIHLPTSEERPKCMSILAPYLSELTLVGAACSDAMDLYFGKTREDGLFFQSNDDDTTWTGLILPLVAKETKDSEDHEERQTNLLTNFETLPGGMSESEAEEPSESSEE